jgi:hypothetical protein
MMRITTGDDESLHLKTIERGHQRMAVAAA